MFLGCVVAELPSDELIRHKRQEIALSRERITQMISSEDGWFVFKAFCKTIAGTELRVGVTENENPETMTPMRCLDYLEAFMAEELAVCETDALMFEESDPDYPGLVAKSYIDRQHLIFTGIAARLDMPE